MGIFLSFRNADAALISLIRQLHLDISAEAIVEELEMHPDYPSIMSLSDILTNFNIENSAYWVEAEMLNELSAPFIAHIKYGGGIFVAVNKINNENVWLTSEKWHNKKFTIAQFIETFNGYVLSITQPDHSGKSRLKSFSRRLIKANIQIVLFVLMISLVVYQSEFLLHITWRIAMLFLTKILGLFTTILLLIQSINSNNPLLNKFCNNVSGKLNCNAILDSDAAKLFPGLSWSEVGLFYFSSTIILLLFKNYAPYALPLLAVINIISLPYTFYSIYYQKFIAQQWCVFCCVVQALLWLEFIPLSANLGSAFILPNRSLIIVFFMSIISPIITWLALKPLFIKLKKFANLRQQLQVLKYNISTFKLLLTSQPRNTIPGKDWTIVLGTVDASHNITVVSNPYCRPCAETHKVINDILDKNENIQISIIFSSDNDEQDRRTSVSRHLIALNAKLNNEEMKEALSAWYGQEKKNYETWAKHYPAELDEKDYSKLNKQIAWCKLAGVKGTPTIFLDGYRLPEIYGIYDIKYLLYQF